MARYRITGASTPVGGTQWERKDDDREIARRVLNLLGDKRMLWEDYSLEVMDDCAASADHARKELGKHLDNPEISEGFAREVRGLQQLFRRFMTDLQRRGAVGWPAHHEGYGTDPLSLALGTLRGLVGAWVGQVAAVYELEVSEELASIVPDVEAWFWEPDAKG